MMLPPNCVSELFRPFRGVCPARACRMGKYQRGQALTVRYLAFARDFNATFPGFETDIHGLVKGEDGRYYVDCVRDNQGGAV